MLEIIAQYWLNFLLGIISGGLVLLCKKLWKMYQNEKSHQKTKEQEEFYKGLQDAIKIGDEKLQKQIDIVTSGILSLQGRNFKQECRMLLKEGHEITIDEFEAINEEHDIYNALGGNHDGDELFGMVKEKARNNITD